MEGESHGTMVATGALADRKPVGVWLVAGYCFLSGALNSLGVARTAASPDAALTGWHLYALLLAAIRLPGAFLLLRMRRLAMYFFRADLVVTFLAASPILCSFRRHRVGESPNLDGIGRTLGALAAVGIAWLLLKYVTRLENKKLLR
jgi:hypothetical protein